MATESFTGKISLTLDMTCEDADVALLSANLEQLLADRVNSFLVVTDYTINVETFSA